MAGSYAVANLQVLPDVMSIYYMTQILPNVDPITSSQVIPEPSTASSSSSSVSSSHFSSPFSSSTVSTTGHLGLVADPSQWMIQKVFCIWYYFMWVFIAAYEVGKNIKVCW